MPAADQALAELCPDLQSWPQRWRYQDSDIPIVEHLRGLGDGPARGSVFSAVPVKVKGCGTFPVRAYLSIAD